MSLKSGHRIVPLLFEEAEKQYQHFRGFRTGTIRLDPDGWFFKTPFIIFADKYYDFKFKPSDVVIMTYPKSGTTWTQEIVIYMARDPRDVVLSYYHYSRLLNVMDFVGSMTDFVEHFVNDTLAFGPFWTHLKEAWNKRSHPNIHYCFYEDMKANPKEEIIRIKKFLDLDITENQINDIVHYTSFQEMSKREDKNVMGSDINGINSKILNKDGGFFRKGIFSSFSPISFALN
ncbi:hypothetical protein Anas_10895 [Armadillidium nasatum]|uniref:Sulfotransferase domain-containing protein n=1 Tax=Armadillidium nasatum TaxID=96803 RepID=A0A5N5TCV8_9CRUS|nr:hypothetical protein Anas_10895 [Armadillidium nasatum]